jgi:Na+/H+ antiporter NhaA
MTATTQARNRQTLLLQFLTTETGSAAILAGATAVALTWANVSDSTYERVWSTELHAAFGRFSISMDVREFVNSGLMTFFFFVIGLEARRELDMGELRVRSRITLPFLAALCSMIVPIGIYLILNAGHPSAGGWGTTMSTDTAFALGALALIGRGLPSGIRTYLLTLSVVDDLGGILVIAFAYNSHIRWVPFAAGIACLAAVLVIRSRGIRYGPAYLLAGIAAWVAFYKSGVHPVVVGLLIGLLTYAYPAARSDLERATDAFRLFREQPTAALAQSAREVVRIAISPNERLQQLYHPGTSYLVVPLFALANAGIVISGSFLARAYSSPLTLGILIGCLVGKPAGTGAGTWLVTRISRGRIKPPVGWGAVAGAGALAAIGFTVSLLIASLAFSGVQLEEAKLGILTVTLAAPGIAWLLFRALNLLPPSLRLRALLGTSEVVTDLVVPVDPDRDHIRGPRDARVTVVEYGDYECAYCGQAEPAVRELLRDYGEVRYVWRHLPLSDVHPFARLAAEAAEAAAKQDKFWEMHDKLFERQDVLTGRDLIHYAGELGLDTDRFASDLRKHAGAARVAEDVDSADLVNVAGTPTFFINGTRHHGVYDIGTLKAAVNNALERATISA